MVDRLASLIVDEGKWLPASMSLALVIVTMLLYCHANLPPRRRVMAAMNLFFGLTIGMMACGHLLAVTTKLALGTLQGSLSILYAIGALLLVPAWRLIRHARRSLASADGGSRTTVVLNAWLALTLVALGPHNLPLAVPALFNVGYGIHSRRAVGWALVSLALVVNVGLFIGSWIFLASGQSFEEFRNIR